MENQKHLVVTNLIKIMNDSELTKVAFADKIGMPEAKWNKIANGNQELRVKELSIIAEKLKMREIDIFTYPKKFQEFENSNNDLDAQLTIKLKENLKERVLELIFGTKDIELLNK